MLVIRKSILLETTNHGGQLHVHKFTLGNKMVEKHLQMSLPSLNFTTWGKIKTKRM